MKIKLLVEDTVYRSELLAEHGLALWVEYNEETFLFDTGQGKVILHNAEKLNVNLDSITKVFLSHGHYDHTGGLEKVLSVNSEVHVYGHPELFIPKYSNQNGELSKKGSEIAKSDIKNFTPVTETVEVTEGVWIIGEVPNSSEFEKFNPDYKRHINKRDTDLITDEFKDDQTVFFETSQGLVILLGCSHAGVVNILEYIKEFTNGQKIHAIIGGMHLISADEGRIKKTVDYLATLDFDLLVPLHCTGFTAVKAMKEAFGERVLIQQTGHKLEIAD
ncbi:MBL fold metallo-hydrolase [Acetohalobium arabaticum]|uniref:Beta-lactamase domain protein n=1 Tax=Acetohalobium arabaticum (strain ATCC 49924 / DSM 5501 / Z-7288) TaxID=574087 RepID=D9QU26_ACEAZ|nr:MBL fold metallo-hydrolase [Acetohalobium arabaticum]ADL13747.1 beta-lactamase domain protein [Acetohalobium arabaticum DSM 5501]